MKKKGFCIAKNIVKNSDMIAVFCACTEYLGSKMPQRVLVIIKCNLMKSCMEVWLNYSEVCSIHYGLSNK